MFRKLPSPAALRTFESAARLGSFKEASEELGVTPTAVSHQIRALESSLDVALFARRTRAIELTEAGAFLAPAVNAGLMRIKIAVDEIAADQSIITVTTTPAFATLRLVPRLPEFYALHPGVTVQLDTSTGLVDLDRDRRIDVAIRYGTGPYRNVHAIPLLTEYFGAFGAPQLIEKLGNVTKATLLETAWQQPVLKMISWAAWLSAAGMNAREERLKITLFDEEHYVLQAAIAGQGLALASSALVGDMVERGLLAPYRPEVMLNGAGYTAVCLPDRAVAKNLRFFLSWLVGAFSEVNTETV